MACCVTNLSCVSVELAHPSLFNIQISWREPPQTSITSAMRSWNGVGLFGFVQNISWHKMKYNRVFLMCSVVSETSRSRMVFVIEVRKSRNNGLTFSKYLFIFSEVQSSVGRI